MLLDGSPEAERRLKSMLHYDVNNGIARRAWARNNNALFAARKAMEAHPGLTVTLPHVAAPAIIDEIVDRGGEYRHQ
jgi:urocanate hydratase